MWDTPGLGDGKEADDRHARNIINKLSEVDENRDALIDLVLVAINQADMAMKGRHWDEVHNCPDETLMRFLEEKADSVRRRLVEATSIKVSRPVFYSAERGYNINKLMDMIIDTMPRERRKLICQ